MKEDILRLFYKGSEIILIGTSHISAESADLVRKQFRKKILTLFVLNGIKKIQKTYIQTNGMILI